MTRAFERKKAETVVKEHAAIADEAEACAAAVAFLYGDELRWSRLAKRRLRHIQNVLERVVGANLASTFSPPEAVDRPIGAEARRRGDGR